MFPFRSFSLIRANHGRTMRKPKTIERLYLDFDGFFASVEQQARPALRGKPVGIVPFDGTVHTCLLYTSPSPRDRTRSRMPSSA